MIAFDATVDRLASALDGAEQIVRDGLVAAYNEGIAEGERRERAAAVAHLRARAQFMENDHSCWAEVALIVAAGDVERGDHCREEKP